jgi:hypothetical protein
MQMNRRDFLKGLSAAAGLALLPAGTYALPEPSAVAVVSDSALAPQAAPPQWRNYAIFLDGEWYELRDVSITFKNDRRVSFLDNIGHDIQAPSVMGWEISGKAYGVIDTGSMFSPKTVETRISIDGTNYGGMVYLKDVAVSVDYTGWIMSEFVLSGVDSVTIS